jgi:hypothetical protein
MAEEIGSRRDSGVLARGIKDLLRFETAPEPNDGIDESIDQSFVGRGVTNEDTGHDRYSRARTTRGNC